MASTEIEQTDEGAAFITAEEVRRRYGIELATAEVLRNAIIQVSRQMMKNLLRTAVSPNIRDIMDGSVMIHQFTGDGVEQVAVTEGCAQHAFSSQHIANFFLEEYRAENLRPGDVVFVNDPYRGSIHQGDVNLLRPVFHGDRLMYLLHDTAHLVDTGGPVPGGFAFTATDTWGESPRIGPTLLYADDVRVRSTWNFVLENYRVPTYVEGDLLALYGTLVTGERLIREVAEAHGWDALEAAGRYLLDLSERRMRAGLARIPDGTYTATDFVDDDGLTPEEVSIAVAFTVKGDSAEIDFSGTQRQPEGASVTAWCDASRAIQGVKFHADPEGPADGGMLRPFHVLLPVGSVVCVTPPHSASCHIDVGCRVVNVVTQAVGQAIPEEAIACDTGTFLCILMHGADVRPGREGVPFGGFSMAAGGWGGTPSADGVSACMTPIGNSRSFVLELVERDWPVVHWDENMVIDSGGAGEHRGGLGCYLTIEPICDMFISLLADRMKKGPPGVNGGGPGMPSFAVKLRKDGNYLPPTLSGVTPAESLMPVVGIFDSKGRPDPDHGQFGLGCETQITKYNGVLRKGEVIRIYSGGGGGWGDPLRRPIDVILRDVRQQLTSVGFAREAYGVVVDQATLAVDEAATSELRRTLDRRRSLGDWTVPTACYPSWPLTKADMPVTANTFA